MDTTGLTEALTQNHPVAFDLIDNSASGITLVGGGLGVDLEAAGTYLVQTTLYSAVPMTFEFFVNNVSLGGLPIVTGGGGTSGTDVAGSGETIVTVTAGEVPALLQVLYTGTKTSTLDGATLLIVKLQ
jgi:hypothetical protein